MSCGQAEVAASGGGGGGGVVMITSLTLSIFVDIHKKHRPNRTPGKHILSSRLTDLSTPLLRPPCDRSTGLQAAPGSPTSRPPSQSNSPGRGGWVLGLG